MEKYISNVDFKEWKIYALKESDFISTYIFSNVNNSCSKNDYYMVIKFSEEKGRLIPHSDDICFSSYYGLCECNCVLYYIKGDRELDHEIDDWWHIYNTASEERDNMYWEEYYKSNPNFEPCVDKEDPEQKIIVTARTNNFFNKKNSMGIYGMDAEKKEYSYCTSTIKLNPNKSDLCRFNSYLKEIIEREKIRS